MLNDAQKTALTSLFQGDRYAALVTAGSDGTIASLANEKRHAYQGTVQIQDLERYCLLHGIYPKLVMGQQATDQLVAATCLSSITLMQNRDIPLNVTDPTVAGMFAALKAASICTDADIAAIAALGTTQISDVEQLAEFGQGFMLQLEDVSSLYHDSRLATYQAQQDAIKAKAQELRSQFPDASTMELLERADQILNGANWGHN